MLVKSATDGSWISFQLSFLSFESKIRLGRFKSTNNLIISLAALTFSVFVPNKVFSFLPSLFPTMEQSSTLKLSHPLFQFLTPTEPLQFHIWTLSIQNGLPFNCFSFVSTFCFKLEKLIFFAVKRSFFS